MDLTARMPDLPALEAEAEALERKAQALRQIAEGIKALNGDAEAMLFGSALGRNSANGAPANGADGPLGQEAVRLIVADHPGVWKVSDLKAEARRRGFPISDTGVEKAVRRMYETGEAKKAGYGKYRFGTSRKEVAIESDASGAAMIAPT
jgi:hypothetical protein